MDLQDMKIRYYETEEELYTIKRSDHEWYLYHSIKNEDALIPVIVGSFISLFLKGGGLLSIGIWIWYFNYCKKNNDALNNDPIILRKRELALKARMHFYKPKK